MKPKKPLNANRSKEFTHVRSVIRKILTPKKTSERQKEIAEALWSILTALRGPDIDISLPEWSSTQIKAATTGVIRAVFLNIKIDPIKAKTGTCYSDMGYIIGRDCTEYAQIRQVLWQKYYTRARYKDDHFVSHAIAAFKNLGLEWSEVNKHL